MDYSTEEEGVSDVHVFFTGKSLICGDCPLNDGYDWLAKTPSWMVTHLMDHRFAGDEVPESIFDELISDHWVASYE